MAELLVLTAAEAAELDRRCRELMAERDAARQQVQMLRSAATEYLRAKDDDSWSSTKDWHKRHDLNKAEDALRERVAVPDTEKGAEQVAQSPETGDVRADADLAHVVGQFIVLARDKHGLGRFFPDELTLLDEMARIAK